VREQVEALEHHRHRGADRLDGGVLPVDAQAVDVDAAAIE
jgi:hypothetical protein